MKRNAVYGVGIGINGRDAAMQATQRALDQIGTARPVLALVFVSQEFNITEVLAGLTSLLGETPLWGFSTLRALTAEGDQPRSVVVAIITGTDLKAQVQWYPNFAQDSPAVARQFIQALKQDIFLPQEILIAADGINGSLVTVCNALGELNVHVAGCTAAGEPSLGKTYCIGKNQAGPGALSAAVLGGRFRLGVGCAHGWQDLGVYFRATRTRDVWVQTLDNAPAAETYARYLGYSAREWAFPPLTDMARLYPLGIELNTQTGGAGPFVEADPTNLLIRSALRVEVDGSLRMSAPVPEGSVVHLMTGDPDACLAAATTAVQDALAALGKATPLLAVALIDASWQLLLEARQNHLSTVLKSALGEIPLVGAYTFGQLVRPALDKPPVLHNQNLEVLVFAEGHE
ncbi:MAG: hypothetical protein EHM21_06295 [Chloroflexi bacterium]|nr:MAG: hypothetical protein EHM21_06295 [Chloroflexota bacterium]